MLKFVLNINILENLFFFKFFLIKFKKSLSLYETQPPYKPDIFFIILKLIKAIISKRTS